MKKFIIFIMLLSTALLAEEWNSFNTDSINHYFYPTNLIFITENNNVVLYQENYLYLNDWNTFKVIIKDKSYSAQRILKLSSSNFKKQYMICEEYNILSIVDSNFKWNSFYKSKSIKIRDFTIQNNYLYFASDSGIGYKANPDSLSSKDIMSYFNTNNSPLPSNNILHILSNKNNGDIWSIVDSAGKIFPVKKNGTNWRTFNTSNSLMPQDSVTCLAIDSSNNCWFGTGLGLVKLSSDYQTWTIYSKENSSLPDNLITALNVDRKGNVWVGTNESISKFDGINWITYTNNAMLDGNVKYIEVDTFGNKWILSQSHVTVFREGGIVGNINYISIDTATYSSIETELPNISNVSYVSPNPFTNNIQIDITIEKQSNVKISISDLQGNRTILSDSYENILGLKQFSFNLSNLVAGAYILEIESNNFKITQTILKL